jgi:hypothetical protein
VNTPYHKQSGNPRLSALHYTQKPCGIIGDGSHISTFIKRKRSIAHQLDFIDQSPVTGVSLRHLRIQLWVGKINHYKSLPRVPNTNIQIPSFLLRNKKRQSRGSGTRLPYLLHHNLKRRIMSFYFLK